MQNLEFNSIDELDNEVITNLFPSQPIQALQHAKKLIDSENRNVSLKVNTIIGVVGAAYSSVTIPLSRATLAMKLPLVSYAATNPDLSQHKVYNQHVLVCTGSFPI